MRNAGTLTLIITVYFMFTTTMQLLDYQKVTLALLSLGIVIFGTTTAIIYIEEKDKPEVIG